MALDPEARGLLDDFRRAGARPVHQMTVAEARAAAWSFKFLGGPPERVDRVLRRLVPVAPGIAIPARSYRPADAGSSVLPALVYFHGGGFIAGNIEICDSFSRALANRAGCVVVAVNYRKAPEHRYPTPLDDCYRATEWVARHARLLGIDPDRIGVAGDSAGGNLAAAVALRARDRAGPRLALQLLLYPSVSCDISADAARGHGTGYGLERADVRHYWSHYIGKPEDALDPGFAPLIATSHANLPPAVIVCGEYDPLIDDSLAYADALRASGVPAELMLVEGMIHGFLWMLGRLEKARRALDETGHRVSAAMAPPARSSRSA